METEKFFKCPYCLQKISMLLDLSEDGEQQYIEDCEVCCNPIEIQYMCQQGHLREFRRRAVQ